MRERNQGKCSSRMALSALFSHPPVSAAHFQKRALHYAKESGASSEAMGEEFGKKP